MGPGGCASPRAAGGAPRLSALDASEADPLEELDGLEGWEGLDGPDEPPTEPEANSSTPCQSEQDLEAPKPEGQLAQEHDLQQGALGLPKSGISGFIFPDFGQCQPDPSAEVSQRAYEGPPTETLKDLWWEVATTVTPLSEPVPDHIA